MLNYDVLTIGDAKLDAFLTISEENAKVRVDERSHELCFKHGEKISVEHTHFSLGGNAANVAVGLSRLEVKATVAAEIGDDEFALKIVNTLGREHIDRAFIHQKHGQESSFSVAINFKGDRTLFSEHVKREHNFSYDGAKLGWIYLTSLGEEWTKPYEKAITYVTNASAKLAFNPGTLQLAKKSSVIEDALKHTTILFVNKEEAQLLVSEYLTDKKPSHDIEALAHDIASLGVKMVVITDGKNGANVLDEDKHFHHQDNFPSIVVERTGAGDAFATGFLGAIVHGLTVKDALKWGSLNAASVIGSIGAEEGLLKKEEMEQAVHNIEH